MNKKTRITLVRHGETIWNRELRLQGSRDIPLSEVGLAQAEAVADRLLQEQFHNIYSSHLQRAHKTASTIADRLQIPHHVHEDLRERHYGELEGMTREEILGRYPGFWEPGTDLSSVKRLELPEELRERAYQAVREIAERHPGENVMIVSHGGTINAFLHRISRGELGTGISKLGNTSITRVVRDEDGSWQIESIGCTKHLDK
ncbi:MAG: histidine phosphatase family protein [Tumebacillaceae bacterium]